MAITPRSSQPSTLVLLSGGLDSAVLLVEEAQHAPVIPVYVAVGLAWEPLELAMAERLLAHEALAGRIAPLRRVEFTMRDVYSPSHWAVRGQPPAYDTPDEDVYLAGRNVVLLAKAGVLATELGARRIALGPLSGNPFPDARPSFFRAMESALSEGLDQPIEIATPFLAWTKEDVIRQGLTLGVPLGLTLSCMNPTEARHAEEPPLHCGGCSKCRERRNAFAAAGLDDPAAYLAVSRS
jgi:7-cyano-7-deazaguanine synthase